MVGVFRELLFQQTAQTHHCIRRRENYDMDMYSAREEGIELGVERNKLQMITSMLAEGLDRSTICRIAQISPDALAIDWKEEAGKIKAKTLIVHGTDDNVVPYRYAQEAVELIPNAELVTVQGGGHWISDDFNQVAYPATDAFLKED